MERAAISAEFQLGMLRASLFAITVRYLNCYRGVRFVCRDLLTDFDVAGAWPRRNDLAQALQSTVKGFILSRGEEGRRPPRNLPDWRNNHHAGTAPIGMFIRPKGHYRFMPFLHLFIAIPAEI